MHGIFQFTVLSLNTFVKSPFFLIVVTYVVKYTLLVAYGYVQKVDGGSSSLVPNISNWAS